MTINFIYNRKNKLNKDGKALLQVRISENLQKRYISTGIYLKPNEWDPIQSKVIRNNHAVDYNIKLEKIKKRIIQSDPGIDNAIQAVKGIGITNVIDWMRSEIEKSHLADSTKAKHTTLWHYLDKYYKDLQFYQMTYTWLKEFESLLRSLPDQRYKNKHVPLKESYIFSLMGVLRKFIKEAMKERLIIDNPFDHYVIRKPESKKEFLWIDEITKIENFDKSTFRGGIEMQIDAFVFSCYTGLRFGDLNRLRGKDIIGSTLHVFPKKTERHLTKVELNLNKLFWSKPMNIWRKYYVSDDRPVFHIYSKCDNIKRICRMCGIIKNISWHTGRHSFAINLLNMGLRIEALQKLMGHKSIISTQVYAKILSSRVDDELDNLFADE